MRINWQRKRNWTTLKELKEEIDTYFEEVSIPTIESLYRYIGITKHDVYNWKKAETRVSKSYKKYHNWHEAIFRAKEQVRDILIDILVGYEDPEFAERRRIIVSETDGEKAQSFKYEISKPQYNFIRHYVAVRWKDDYHDLARNYEVIDESDGEVVINLNNQGDNKC